MDVRALMPDWHALRSPRTLGDAGLVAGMGGFAAAFSSSWQQALAFVTATLIFVTQLLKQRGEMNGLGASLRAELATLRTENQALKDQNADQQAQIEVLKSKTGGAA